MSWDLRALGGAVQRPCGELAWTKPQIFRVLASVEAMRGVVLGGDVLFGNGTYTGSSWQYCLTCEDHYVAFLRENCRGSRRTAEAFIRDFLATRSGEFLFAPVLREGVDAYIHRTVGLRTAVTVCRKSPLDFSGKEILLRCGALQTRCGVCVSSGWAIRTG